MLLQKQESPNTDVIAEIFKDLMNVRKFEVETG